MGKVPKFFKFAFLEIVLIVFILIGLIAILFFLNILPKSLLNLTSLSTSSDNKPLAKSELLHVSSRNPDYSLSLSKPEVFQNVLKDLGLFEKPHRFSEGTIKKVNTLEIILIDKDQNVSKSQKVMVVMENKSELISISSLVENDSLILYAYSPKNQLDKKSEIIEGLLMTQILEYIFKLTHKSNDLDRQSRIFLQDIYSGLKNDEVFFLIKNK